MKKFAPTALTFILIVSGSALVSPLAQGLKEKARTPPKESPVNYRKLGHSQDQDRLDSIINSGQVAGGSGTASPRSATGPVYSAVPALSEEQLELREREWTKEFETVPLRQDPVSSVLAPANPPTEPVSFIPSQRASAAEPQAANDFKFKVVHDLSSSEAPNRSVINEPSVANMGNTVFYTGNWYAARSANGGQSFTYVSPFSTFPSINGGFCCDQQANYAPNQNMMLWALQYVKDSSSGTLRIARAVGSTAVANNTWVYYDFNPQMFGYATGNWMDFPTMTVSANYLYLTSNVFTTSGDDFTGSVIWRIPLSELSAGGTVNFNYLKRSEGSLRCAEGAGTTMYFGTLASTSQLRIFRWDDASGTIFFDTVNITSFSSLNREGVATSPDGTNWAARADSRILGGWVAGGVIGFMWGAKQGGSFPYPYTIIARFNQSNRALISQNQLWSSQNGWLYPTVSVNSAGNLAGLAVYGGGTYYPGTNIWISDDVQNGFNPVALYGAASSNDGPNANAWGDFHTIRPHKDFPNSWVAGTHYLQNGGAAANVVPRYLWFGRERDLGATSTPNLTPFKPTGWSDKIVVSKTTGSNTDSSPLRNTDSLYIDWAVINNGTGPTSARFFTKLFVDGVERTSWFTDPPLNSNYYAYVTDYPLGTLSVGNHTLRIVADSSATIAESNESDNEFTRTISITAAVTCNLLTANVNPGNGGTVNLNTSPNCSSGQATDSDFATGTLPELISSANISSANISSASQLPRAAETSEAFRTLIEKAQTSGSARVIIGLNLPFLPEGILSLSHNVLEQRAAILQSQDRLLAQLPGVNGASVKKFPFIPYMALEVDVAGLEYLQASPEIYSIEEDLPVPATLAQSVPLIGASNAWAAGYSGAGRTVAILDTGVDKTHSFLSGKVVSEACYSTTNASSSSVCPGGVSQSTAAGSGVNCTNTISGCSHGTHVAGIAAGKGATFSGVAKDASIIAIQVFSRFNNSSDCQGSAPCVLAYTSDYILGLQRVQALSGSYSIAAANLSLGGGRYFSNCDSTHSSTKAAIDSLRSLGIATVIASGNDGFSDSISSPACISTAISVGSTDDGSNGTVLNAVSSFSNSASFLSLLAPGRWINSSVPGGGFSNFQGTSMATPHVVGAWAVLKSKSPTASVTQILSALSNTGLAITDSRNNVTKPRIKVDTALNDLGGGATGQYTPGTAVSLSATPKPGFAFQSWSGCDSVSGSNCTVTMNAARTVTANFSAQCSAPGAFTQTVPSNLQTFASSTTTVTLSWGASANATSYDVYFGTSSNPPFLGNQTGTSRTVNVTSGQTYYWKIVARVSCNSSLTSTTTIRSFSVQSCLAPGAFTQSSPSNGQSFTAATTTVPLSWGASANATSYDVYFGTSSNPPFLGNQTGTSRTVNVTSGQTYYWKIVARVSCNSSLTSTTTIRSFSVQSCLAPGAFTQSSPINGQSFTATTIAVPLSWGASANATSYDVYFGTSSNPPFLGNQTGTSRTVNVTSGQTYYWRIVARVSCNSSLTSTTTIRSFSVQSCLAPGAFTQSSPSNGQSFTAATTTVPLSWGASANATSYDVYFGTSSNPPFLANQTGTSRTVSVTSGQTYYWKIVARVGCNSSLTSATTIRSFSIAQSSFQLLLEQFGPVPNLAAAIDAFLLVRDPFPVINGANVLNQTNDKNTRVLIFLSNFQLGPGENAASVVVNLVGSNNQSFDVVAEDVRPLANLPFTQVTFRLPDNLAIGTCTIRIKAHGQVSNSAVIRIKA